MIAVAGMLDIDDPGKVFKICADYPLEIVWAISEKRIVSLAPYIMELLETRRDDAYLLNRILQCLARVGDANALSLGMKRAGELLQRQRPPLDT